MSSGQQRKRAVLVLGMHRSGTSALMRVINLLGADIGNDLLPPAADNPSGFWEHGGVVRIHDELLSALDRTWHDVRALPANWISGDAAAVARAKLVDLLRGEFADSTLWAVKDPRICRLLPLWLQVLEELETEAHAIFVVRHPDEVAQSVLVRNQIPVAHTRLSWVEHMVEAELASRKIKRVAASYEDLLADWPDALKRITEDLAIRWPVANDDAAPAINQFLEKGARHHTKEDVKAGLPDLAQRVYDVFLAKARVQGSNWQEIEQVSNFYSASAGLFLDSVGVSTGQVFENIQTIASLEGRIETLCLASREIAAQTYLHSAPVDILSMGDRAKVYYRHCGEDFAEERSVSVPHQGLWTAISFKFVLPPGLAPDFIRFDPSESPGEFAMVDMHISGRLLHYKDDDLSIVGTHVIAVSNDEIRLASLDTDPHVEMDLRGVKLSSEDAVVVEVLCGRITPYVELAKLVDNGLLKLDQRRVSDDTARAAKLAALTDGINTIIDGLHAKAESSEVLELGNAVKMLVEFQQRSLVGRIRSTFKKRTSA